MAASMMSATLAASVAVNQEMPERLYLSGEEAGAGKRAEEQVGRGEVKVGLADETGAVAHPVRDGGDGGDVVFRFVEAVLDQLQAGVPGQQGNELLLLVADDGIDFVDAALFEGGEDGLDKRDAADGNERFGDGVGEWPQAGA